MSEKKYGKHTLDELEDLEWNAIPEHARHDNAAWMDRKPGEKRTLEQSTLFENRTSAED